MFYDTVYRLSGQTSIISLYSITWLIFITETQCVYSAVRTVSLSIVQVIADAFSRRLLTAEALVRSQVSPCEICGGKIGTGTRFSLSTSDFPVVIPPILHADPYLYVALTGGTNVRSLGTFQKVTIFRKSESVCRKVFSLFVSVSEGSTFRTCILPPHIVCAFHETLVQDVSFPSIEVTDLSIYWRRIVLSVRWILSFYLFGWTLGLQGISNLHTWPAVEIVNIVTGLLWVRVFCRFVSCSEACSLSPELFTFCWSTRQVCAVVNSS